MGDGKMLICGLILGSIIALIILISYMSLKIEVLITREDGDDFGEIIFSVLKYLRYKVTIPIAELGARGLEVKAEDNIGEQKGIFVNLTKIKHWKRLGDEFLRDFINVNQIIRWFCSKITCEKLVWTTILGTGNADETGILSGLTWGIKNSLVGMFSHYLHWNKAPLISVTPHFNDTMLQYYFNGIVRFRIGYAILMLKKLWMHRKTR